MENTKGNIFSKIIKNPIFTSLFIAAIVVSLVLIIFYKEIENSRNKIVKFSIYASLAIFLSIYAHYAAIDKCFEQQKSSDRSKLMVTGAGMFHPIPETTTTQIPKKIEFNF